LGVERIKLQGLADRRQRLLVPIRRAVDARQVAPQVGIFRDQRERRRECPGRRIEASVLPMNKTELSQGRGRMPVLIDDAAEIRQARL
jgi:hypothetical protein